MSIVIKKFFSQSGSETNLLSFGDELKQRRKRKGLTQEALVKAAKDVCTAGYISNLERNQDIGKKGQPTRPSVEIVDALADVLDWPRDQARLAAGHAPGDAPSRNGYDESEFALYASKLKKLTAQQKRDFYLFWNAAKEVLDKAERENKAKS